MVSEIMRRKASHMKVEKYYNSVEFDQQSHREIERKFIPLFPLDLEIYRTSAFPIEQYYLSHPSEPFSLRLRESLEPDGALHYTATLKDNGVLTADGIDRMEVTAPVDSELYEYFRQDGSPLLRKLRAEPLPGITIDFYDDGSTQVESEHPEHWKRFIDSHGEHFVEITGDHISSNEWRAHLSFRRAHNGIEALTPAPELDPSAIVHDILSAQKTMSPVVIHVGGRSGSGKSTIVHEVRRQLDQLGLSSTVMSTDDYHRGTSSLMAMNNGQPWEHWDEPIVYDTVAIATDLAHLYNGKSIYRRSIDWGPVEPVYDGVITPCDVVIIEGIYALSPDITRQDELRYEMMTPLATCIGRRLLRDIKERPEFANPVKSLSYMLREAEPAYRRQTT